jgi:DnaJ-class molecular chaperone
MGTEGEYWRSRRDHREKKKRYLVVCNKCGGKGYFGTERCVWCQGSGKVDDRLEKLPNANPGGDMDVPFF